MLHTNTNCCALHRFNFISDRTVREERQKADEAEGRLQVTQLSNRMNSIDPTPDSSENTDSMIDLTELN
jgi:hypothetical protein